MSGILLIFLHMTHLVLNMNTFSFQHGTSKVSTTDEQSPRIRLRSHRLRSHRAFPGVDHSSMIIPQIINPPMALVPRSLQLP